MRTETDHLTPAGHQSPIAGSATKPRIDDSWRDAIGGEFDKPYMQELRSFLRGERDAKKIVHPRPSEYFNAFNHAPFERVRVVILGQDPYHGPGQAHGLCFSVRPGTPAPPSLVNIFKERESDLGLRRPDHGYLMPWANRGALLLNSVLTVENGKPASHQGRGWEAFTDRAIEALSDGRAGIAFVLWGAYAQKKGRVIDRRKHFVLEGPHPSPLSASRGFFGSKPFSKINDYFAAQGQAPFDWSLPALERLRELDNKQN